ncbi:MAG: hypothetical protein ACJAX5_001164 [Patiriisocius sp.]|jgi:hypothetical protein
MSMATAKPTMSSTAAVLAEKFNGDSPSIQDFENQTNH